MTSTMSGIVFNANPASMVNLMRKLETVDDSSNSSQNIKPDTPSKIMTTTQVTVERIPDQNNPGDQNVESKKISRHLAFMKFISEFTEKKSGAHQRPRSRATGGSMKINRKPAKVSKTSRKPLPRRYSSGVLPGIIGIGSGVVVDYHEHHHHLRPLAAQAPSK